MYDPYWRDTSNWIDQAKAWLQLRRSSPDSWFPELPSDEEEDEEELRKLAEAFEIYQALHWFIPQVYEKIVHRAVSQPNDFALLDVKAAAQLIKLAQERLLAIQLQRFSNQQVVMFFITSTLEDLDKVAGHAEITQLQFRIRQ